MAITGTRKIILVLILITITAAYWYGSDTTESLANKYKTRSVERGDIMQTISANGTLTPVVLVNVGTQVSGTVAKLHADFNDRVEIGQILAELDPAILRAQLQQSKANLLNAQVTLRIAESKLRRHRLLKEKEFISSEALEIVEQETEAARAQLAINKAQVERDQANLNYSVIRSPISGVVIARDVDIGQTVAANFQTPILFQIAKDLRQMQINISVAEADIGQLHIGQLINFTVDAFQQRKFSGTVKQVRLNPTIQENVVTYNVVAMVDNDDGTLLPGMTANIHFVVMQKNDVLRVPNAALRFQPKDLELNEGGKVTIPSQQPTVYLLTDNQPSPIAVATGITDGNFTEIISNEIKAGDKVILSEVVDKKESESKFKLLQFAGCAWPNHYHPGSASYRSDHSSG
jgi:HlyD family secretion protein